MLFAAVTQLDIHIGAEDCILHRSASLSTGGIPL